MPVRGPSLRWPVILAVAVPLGSLFAALTIFGTIHGLEKPVALSLIVTIAIGVWWRAAARPIRDGFLIAFLGALVAVELQALFLPLYFENNPAYANMDMPFGWPPRLVTSVLGPINALIAGAMCAAMAWGLVRLTGGRSGAEAQR